MTAARVSWVRLASASAMVSVLLAGCASSAPFHDHWEAGRYETAAEDFQTDSTLREDPRALLRMALLQLSPELPVHDPGAARDNLEAALEMDLEPADHRQATLLLQLVGRMIQLRDQLQALKAIDLERAPRDTSRIP
jgi:hypothetical protein